MEGRLDTFVRIMALRSVLVKKFSANWVLCRCLIGGLFCFCGLALSLPNTWAKRPSAPKLLPKMTLAYMRVADSRELVDAFRQTSMGRLGQDKRIRPLLTQLYGSTAQAFAEAQEKLDVSLDELLEIPQGEACLAVVGREEGEPAVVVLVDVGESLPAARRLLNGGARQSGQSVRTEEVNGTELTLLDELSFCDRDNTVLLSSSAELIKEMLTVWDGEEAQAETLADNPQFTTIMRRSRGGENEPPQLSWFVDPITLVDHVTRSNNAARITLAMLPLLGLDGIKSLGGSVTLATEEFDSVSHVHLLLDSPRKGILNMVAIEAGEVQPEDWVPRDAASYMTINWNFQRTFDELQALVDEFRGEGAFQETVQKRFSMPLEIDFQQDVLDQLDDRITHVRWFQKPARINSGTNLVGIKLKDADGFKETLSAMLAKAGERATEKSHRGVDYYELKSPANRRSPERALVRRPTPCLAVVGDHLLLSDSVQCLQAAIAAKRNSRDTFADQLDYKLIASRIEQELGGRQPAMISFQRPEESLRSFYELATSTETRRRLDEAAQDNRALRIINDALRTHPLPPFSVIAKYLAPGGGMLVSDSSGLHYTGFSLKRE